MTFVLFSVNTFALLRMTAWQSYILHFVQDDILKLPRFHDRGFSRRRIKVYILCFDQDSGTLFEIIPTHKTDAMLRMTGNF